MLITLSGFYACVCDKLLLILPRLHTVRGPICSALSKSLLCLIFPSSLPKNWKLDRRKPAALSCRDWPVNDVGSVPDWEGQSYAAVSIDVVE